MKEECCTFWIVQDRTIEHFSWTCMRFFKTREEWPQRQFRDHQGCFLSFRKGDGHLIFNKLDNLCPKRGLLELWEWCSPKLEGLTPPSRASGMRSQCIWKAEHWAQKNHSLTLRSHEVCLAGFWTYFGTHHIFLLSYFSLLEWECQPYHCPIIVFWKHISCLISQIHSWGGILPQNKAYFESHLYLIY